METVAFSQLRGVCTGTRLDLEHIHTRNYGRLCVDVKRQIRKLFWSNGRQKKRDIFGSISS
ncbi:hypothetical protein TGVAND_214783 [Toxoplasma gondii VAND]|uniref:Uncharacterized protein n=6 Tax=Toxoplasma gondii TaxID=5811 RepID=V4YSC1_TOXGV|nr:hypothetical protein TGVEG_214783 [Toxoplasma gondii VEG]KFG39213.1 hypothetical protein TGFOU_214783 [Toxoplasma gondii FOU]KFG41600.1 hypothetical protein TGP89_214783 [Toxoplasma gondii p89]KFH07877.1 hypothetical protein TGVAND_214783 [Toxoplasma gondii VAND]PUA86417.1 hypothetical protein TGBR9_214783 [Toxoplasma gondii TgCATBr9]RQX69958.1 hypothetical protein TGCAST_214783 [Toxoplasma gondii CAST]